MNVTTVSKSPAGSGWPVRIFKKRIVQIGILVWLAFAAAIPFLAHGVIPFDQPALSALSYRARVLSEIFTPALALALIGIIWLLTRRRVIPDVGARAPERIVAMRETTALLFYGAIVLIVGQFAGRVVGTHGIGLHLPGSMFGLSDAVAPREVYAWAIYNFVFYAVLPYVYFRRRGYSHEALCLKSSNLVNDILVIAVVLAILLFSGPLMTNIRHLGARRFAIGGTLAFFLSLLGTGFPIMIYLCAILVPRYQKLTGSTAATCVLTGFTYASLHLTEYWTRYDSPAHGVLSMIFIVLLYSGPGLVKGYLTLRTGNAWVHLWGFHAISPHVDVDTPIFVKIFNIR